MSLIHRLSARAHFLLSPLLAARFHHRPLSCNSPLHPLPILHHLPRRSVILATSHICSRSREALIRGGFVGDRLRPRVRQEEGLGSHQLRRATPWWRGCPHPVRRKGCFVSPLPTGSRFIAILATRGLNVRRPSRLSSSCSKIFGPIHPKGIIERTLPLESFIGFVDPATLPDDAGIQTEDELRVEYARRTMLPLGAMVNLHDFEVRFPL